MTTTPTNEPEVGSAVQIRHDLVTDAGAPDDFAGLHGSIVGRDPFGGYLIKIGHHKPAHFGRQAFIVTAAPSEQKDPSAPAWHDPFAAATNTDASEPAAAVRLVNAPPLAAINSATNPRRRRGLDLDSLRTLADSITTHGLAQPILVRPLPSVIGDETRHITDPAIQYEVVAGERRWRAAQLAELPTMPMLVRDLTDGAVLEIQLVENIEREDMDPMEEAEGFALLREKLGYTVEQIAAKMGKGRGPSYVRKRMKLLDLTPESREAMYDGTLQLSTGLLVAKYPAATQSKAVKIIKGMNSTGADGHTIHAPFRTVALELYRKLNTLIKTAAFDTTDPGLVFNAGPCSACPKRSQAETDLFGEATDAGEDSCLDTACWDAKKTAHVARTVAAARDRGLQVLEEAEALDVFPSPYSSIAHGYTPITEVAYTETGDDGKDRAVTWGDVLRAQGRKAPKPVLIINPHNSKALEAIPDDLAKKLLPQPVQQARQERMQQAEAEYKARNPEAPPEWHAIKRPEVRRAALLRAFDIIGSRERTLDDMRLMAHNVWECEPELTEQWLGWKAEFDDTDFDALPALRREKLHALDATQLASAITMACLESEVTDHLGHWSNYRPADDRAHQALQAYGIDVLAVQAKVDEDLERQNQPEGAAVDTAADAGDGDGGAGGDELDEEYGQEGGEA